MAENDLNALRAGKLQGAKRLNLSAGLTALPPEVFDVADTLEVLDLSGNALDSLPDDLPRLHKLRVLFCSNNPFSVLPEVLGDCPALSMVGFKACQIKHVHAAALPKALRWLVLTDNSIATLPETLGQRTALQKLMLAGNQLTELPESLADCRQLELVRISANAMLMVPGVLLELPHLAWLACGGNPWSASLEAAARAADKVPSLDAAQLRWGPCLGEGASGVIQAVETEQGQALAAKLFKGQMTSDGWPQTEIAASMRAGQHPNVLGGLASLRGHESGREGMLMERLDAQWTNLAGPPSLETCTRDVYSSLASWPADVVLKMAHGLALALTLIHERGLVHGDVYAHNVLHDGKGGVRLGDFGAATLLPLETSKLSRQLQAFDVRALGCLLEELNARCSDLPAGINAIHQACDGCLLEDPLARPRAYEVATLLAKASAV